MKITNFVRLGLVMAGALIVAACGSSSVDFNGQRVGGIWFGEYGSPFDGPEGDVLVIGSESGQIRELDPAILTGDYYGRDIVITSSSVDDPFIHRVTEFRLPDIEEVLTTACAFGEYLELDVLPPEENADCSTISAEFDQQELLDGALIRAGDTQLYVSPGPDGINEEFAGLLCESVGLELYSEGCEDYLGAVFDEDNFPVFPSALRVYGHDDFLGLSITGDLTEGEGPDVEENEAYFSLVIDLGIVEFLDEFIDEGDVEDVFYLLTGLTMGEAEDDLYFQPSSLDQLAGAWSSINAPAGFYIEDTGFFEGGEDGPCRYTGWFDIIDAQYNMYAMTLLADCGDGENEPEDGAAPFSGVYEGLAFIADAGDVLLEGDFDFDENEEVMVFHVSNNGAVINDALVYEGLD